MTELIAKQSIDELKEALVNKKETIAIAESVTAGVLQAVLSAATEAATFFQGGITTYNLGQKVKHLGVEPIHAKQCNCVSQQTASEMAIGVAGLFISDWGVAISGYASPMPDSGNELYAYCAICYKGEVVHEEKIIPRESDFFPVQLEYALRVVEIVKREAL